MRFTVSDTDVKGTVARGTKHQIIFVFPSQKAKIISLQTSDLLYPWVPLESFK